MPTFTDLYYKTATHEANAGLKPEVTQSFMLGSRYHTNGFSATVQGFYHRGSDMIDWVMYTADDVYHSTNFRLNNYGIEGRAEVDFRALLGEKSLLHNFTVGYTYMYQDRKDEIEIYKSNYALEYLRHKFTASLTHGIFSRLSASWDFRWQERMGSYIVYADHKSTGTLKSYKPYGVLDLKIQWTAPTYTLYVTGNNILDCHYYDYGNVPQPGIWIMAGGTYRFNL
jgi:iron complex outermembrane receptor protein